MVLFSNIFCVLFTTKDTGKNAHLRLPCWAPGLCSHQPEWMPWGPARALLEALGSESAEHVDMEQRGLSGATMCTGFSVLILKAGVSMES